MDIQTPTLELLFQQLGLDGDQPSIDAFVSSHALPADVKVSQATFWSKQQGDLLKEKMQLDDDWAPVVDELNVLLHPTP